MTYTLPIEAGAFIRGQIRRAIKQYCYERHYNVRVKEDRGWLESLLYFEIDIPDDQVRQAVLEINEWLKEVAS